MLAAPDQQISLTDPDSRSMATSGRGSGVVGYNVQVAVDTEHHLIATQAQSAERVRAAQELLARGPACWKRLSLCRAILGLSRRQAYRDHIRDRIDPNLVESSCRLSTAAAIRSKRSASSNSSSPIC